VSANLEFKRTVQICLVDCRSIIHLDCSATSVSTQVDVNPSTTSDPALSFSFFVEVIVVGHTPGHVFWLFWPVAGGSQAQTRLMIFRPSETFRLSLPAGHCSYNWAAASSKRREVIISSVKADQGSFLNFLRFFCLQHPILCTCTPIANVGYVSLLTLLHPVCGQCLIQCVKQTCRMSSPPVVCELGRHRGAAATSLGCAAEFLRNLGF
jgi:hypothetical protein